MEKRVVIHALADNSRPPPLLDRETALETFAVILARGRSLYSDDENSLAERPRRVCRIVALEES